jgi:hypothetical protein
MSLGVVGAMVAGVVLGNACGSGARSAGGDGGTIGGGDSGTIGSGDGASGGPSCGYQNQGTALHVAANIDLCMPSMVCDPETCPPPLGQCVGGRCVFGSGYQGVATLPQAWATYYCTLATGGCHGVTQIDFPEVTAQMIGTQLGHPLCDTQASDKCIGIAASSPMVVGNSQVAIDPATGQLVKLWGLGLTEASGLCYQISGPGGTAIVALTDRCGGYCKCAGNAAFQECGPCTNSSSLTPNCPCVGTAGTLYTQCCGRGCATTNAECDWCASNNHPHFDLDTATFNWVCGAQANLGSCQLSAVSYLPCMTPKAWPPH